EGAHVVQQRAGVQLSSAVGQVGDAYEQHADAVAARVVAGESAQDLLSTFTGGAGGGAIQRKEETTPEVKGLFLAVEKVGTSYRHLYQQQAAGLSRLGSALKSDKAPAGSILATIAGAGASKAIGVIGGLISKGATAIAPPAAKPLVEKIIAFATEKAAEKAAE